MPRCRIPAALLVALALASVTRAEGETPLAPGAAAPKLAVTEWVKGEPVASFEEGKVYVVEFWATWCGPCIASIPHLNKLQKKHGADRLAILGVTAADPNNPLDRVKALVAERGEGMSYRVAWDAERATYDAYMKAAGRSGIPTSFVVDKKGRVAFIGHPREIGPVVSRCINGTWDPATSPAELQALFAEVNAALSGGTPAEMLARLDDIGAKSPDVIEMMANQVFELMLMAEKSEEASLLGGRLVDEAIEYGDAMGLNQVAWTIVDPAQKWTSRDLVLARRAAEKAVALSKEKDGAILDTLARVEFLDGHVDRAIEIQKRAIGITTDPRLRKDLDEALKEYEAAQAERQPG